MEEPLKGDGFGRAGLRQLRGLARFPEARESKATLPGKEMVEAVAEIGKAASWLATRTMAGRGSYQPVPRGDDYGRSARLDRLYKLAVWLGINSSLHQNTLWAGLGWECGGTLPQPKGPPLRGANGG